MVNGKFCKKLDGLKQHLEGFKREEKKERRSFEMKQDGSCLSVLEVLPSEGDGNKMPSCVPCVQLLAPVHNMLTLIQTHAGARQELWFQSSDSGL